jgi:hypothetical protein
MQVIFGWRHIEATRVTSTFRDFFRQLSSAETVKWTPRFLSDHRKHAYEPLNHVSQSALTLAYTQFWTSSFQIPHSPPKKRSLARDEELWLQSTHNTYTTRQTTL